MADASDATTPYIDPDMRPVLARMVQQAAQRPTLGTSSPADMRRRFSADVVNWNLELPDVARIENLLVHTSTRAVPIRLYDAAPAAEARPVVVFFHGGGWVVGDLDSNERALRLLAIHSGVVVVSVDYCLAPEHKFPAPLDECVAVVRWLREHGAQWGINASQMAVGGDSAGANLALATTLDLRAAGDPGLGAMLLIYGVYARDHDSDSHRLFGDGRFGFGTEAMDALWSMYLARPADAENPRAAPLRAELSGLPPAIIVAGGLDPLRDDSRRLAARLVAVGGQVEYREYPGVVHGFMGMTRDLAVTRRATAEVADSLRRLLVARP